MGEEKTRHFYKNNIRTVISFILSVINISLAASLEMWTKTASRLTVMLFGGIGAVVFYLLIDFMGRQRERRLRVHALLWGFPMALAYVLGCRMRRDGTALAHFRELPWLIVQVGCLTVPAAAFVCVVLRGGACKAAFCQSRLMKGVRRLCGRDDTKSAQKERKRYAFRQVWLVYSLVIFLCWLPVFLAYYPSVFAYDAEGQLYQVIAHDYSTHHPLLHTLFLGVFFRLGERLPGSYSAGMAVHSVVQMMMMAAAFGYTTAYLYRKEVPAYARNLLLIFYALFPTNSVLALSTTKDVLFSALVLLYALFHERLVTEQESGITKKSWFLYVLCATLLLLFRNNAVYAFVLASPVVCVGLYRMRAGRPGVWKKYLCSTVAVCVLFLLGSVSLKAATDANNGSPREMLSIPLQQMARTRVKAEETLSPKMRQELENYLPSEWVFAAYNPYLADPVKNRAVIHDDPAGLIKTWIKLGTEHPQIYIDAFLDNSIGYWFIEDRTHAQIYGIGTQSGFGYLSTDNRTMPAGCEIVEHSYLPGLRRFLEKIVSDNAYQAVPGIRILFAPAFYWWLLCMYMAVALYRRKYRLLLPAVFFVVYYMTLLLSPTVLIRYMYPFVVSVPSICCCLSVDLVKSGGKIYNKN